MPSTLAPPSFDDLINFAGAAFEAGAKLGGGLHSASVGAVDGSWIVIVAIGSERVEAMAGAIAAVAPRDPVREALQARVNELEAMLAGPVA